MPDLLVGAVICVVALGVGFLSGSAYRASDLRKKGEALEELNAKNRDLSRWLQEFKDIHARDSEIATLIPSMVRRLAERHPSDALPRLAVRLTKELFKTAQVALAVAKKDGSLLVTEGVGIPPAWKGTLALSPRDGMIGEAMRDKILVLREEHVARRGRPELSDLERAGMVPDAVIPIVVEESVVAILSLPPPRRGGGAPEARLLPAGTRSEHGCGRPVRRRGVRDPDGDRGQRRGLRASRPDAGGVREDAVRRPRAGRSDPGDDQRRGGHVPEGRADLHGPHRGGGRGAVPRQGERQKPGLRSAAGRASPVVGETSRWPVSLVAGPCMGAGEVLKNSFSGGGGRSLCENRWSIGSRNFLRPSGTHRRRPSAPTGGKWNNCSGSCGMSGRRGTRNRSTGRRGPRRTSGGSSP